ncbi:MAG: cbb3-type cytochrome oxidase assembly protein CcoS [Halothiobacillaceae bacterium]
MNVLYFFVPLSLVVMALLIYAAIWSIRNNQYEDMDSPAHRILMDDDDPRIPHNREQKPGGREDAERGGDPGAQAGRDRSDS